ncbi:hypothetical protein TELCIR_09785 [Teladorsagia circumcincta]|uniref:Uncharacterized protein n=1 Tax=Teladorsagia circumcincta TaxID=45464 RepID=A0A2G9UDV3_TELCI|nr:hypothetical protein TELCIR_09785 [Teladorsagia circumcincta]
MRIRAHPVAQAKRRAMVKAKTLQRFRPAKLIRTSWRFSGQYNPSGV